MSCLESRMLVTRSWQVEKKEDTDQRVQTFSHNFRKSNAEHGDYG